MSGDGQGMLLVHDLADGKLLWGLGANAGEEMRLTTCV
jgi:hypothetical protein